jgi:Competence-damaged protein
VPEPQPIAERVAVRLTERGETIAIAESAAGGLIAAGLLTVPGASRYFLGGAVLYTRAARQALLGITPEDYDWGSACDRSLCAACGAPLPRAAGGDLGPRRDRRSRSGWQPLWRSRRPHLHRCQWAVRRGPHDCYRLDGPGCEHACVRRRARTAGDCAGMRMIFRNGLTHFRRPT